MKVTRRALGCASVLALLVAHPLASSQEPRPAASAERADAKARLSKSDQRYLSLMAEANLAEVQLSNVALAKAESPQVKQFAQHMVDDHGKLLSELKSIAAGRNTALPPAPDKKHQEAAKQLERLSATAFDRAYMQQMVQDHEATLKNLQQIAAKADDPQIKQAAQKAVPEVKDHLEKARSVAAAAGAKVSAQQ
jgi:putative membrane protein